MKTCKGPCKETKDESEFYKHKRAKGGVRNHCKSCCRAYEEENKESIKAYQKTHSQTPKGKFSAYKASAKERDIPFDLTFEEFSTFWQKPCVYSGHEIATIGLDRIDSSKGYTIDNVLPCCSICNIIKMDYDIDFINNHIFQMLKHQGII